MGRSTGIIIVGPAAALVFSIARPHLATSILALVGIAPLLWFLYRQRLAWWRWYILVLLFTGFWILSTTTWYYAIFPWWLAALASVGYAALLAWVFALPAVLRMQSPAARLGVVMFGWWLLESVRLYVPITRDWWIPHLANTQWMNPLVVRAAAIAGVPAVIAVVLLANVTLAWFLLTRRYRLAIAWVLAVTLSCVGYDRIVRLDDIDATDRMIVVGVQASPRGGGDATADHADVEALKTMTANAVRPLLARRLPMVVVWPENTLPPAEQEHLAQFVGDLGIHLAFNRPRSNPIASEHPYNEVALMTFRNPEGITLATKRHPAPGERITPHEFSQPFISSDLGYARIIGGVCYDLHYPDIGDRLRGNDLLLGVIDDDRYGNLLPFLHAADIVYRAAEHRIAIVTGSTSGPTMVVDRHGVVRAGPLPVGAPGVLVHELPRSHLASRYLDGLAR